jgi:WD40 repeat protein
MKAITRFMFLLLLATNAQAQTDCAPRNTSFIPGEELTYEIYYNWGAIWMAAGQAVFSVQQENYKGKQAYHFKGAGTSYPKYDWFFKVRDRFESWSDTNDLRPMRFIRDSHEGPTDIYNDCVFDHKKKMVFTGSRAKDNTIKLDSVKIPNCTLDVLTAIYYSRCIDFSKYKPNDTIPITFVLDNQVYPVYIRYIGKAVYKSDKSKDSFNCIKFKPLLIEGTIFKGGENMTVWVTDDKNKLPLFVETKIVVGSIKVYLSGYKGLRNAMSARVAQ